MQAFEIEELMEQQRRSGQRYAEFLRLPALSVGLYHLEAGATDPQSPHTEDEVYYVVSGKAMIRVAGEDRAVRAGSIVFVQRDVEHRFHSIEEALDVIVFFAPAEYSSQSKAGRPV